ncbi:MAG: MTH1187 family thiamine-binding protein [candidate division Zixibacteria bacterium]|nr:MTH1187 family thiamine-binding protein [candidate division Zixibacteria bacterium]MDH3938360.1 MTH1187 family thiamine-binding protein [candidate division Zixibacteria bacterium]
MLFNLTMFPTSGRKASISADVARVIDLVDKSGLPYKLSPMSTAIEGDWDSVMTLINKARRMLRRSHDRIYIQITIDDRKGAKSRLTGKVASIEKRLKRVVRK